MIPIDVLLVCYNQEKYIKKALESILIQRVPDIYYVNIIIADDCSSDSTVDFIKAVEANGIELGDFDKYNKDCIYVKKTYSFRYLSNTHNLGINKNYYRSFNTCTSDYIAVLEGDDFWSSPFHLMQHITFLDFHRECSMSMNCMSICIEETGEFIEQWWPYKESVHYVCTKEQISTGNKLGNLSACVFRRTSINSLPDTMFDMPIADWMIGVMLSQKGYLALLKLSTSVYRKNANSKFASLSIDEKIKSQFDEADLYDNFQNHVFNSYWCQFKKRLSKQNKTSVKSYIPPFLVTLLKFILPPIIIKKLYK